MIYYVLRAPLSEDPRMQKYVAACKVKGIKYKIISWDRLCNCKTKDDNEIQFKKYMPYGCGRQNKGLLILWSLFVQLQLLKDIFHFRVVHAVNFENYLITYPFKLFGKKVILDVYDSSSFSLEPKMAKTCDMLILPHERRLERMGLTSNQVNNLLIVENTPTLNLTFPEKRISVFPKQIRLSYVGSFEKSIRGIENVLEMVASDSRFTLDIAGSGVGLDAEIKAYSSNCPRIKYYGKVEYHEALKIMHESDFIVALYYLNYGDGHKWACPNKICESLFLMTPVITTKGTLVGNDVEQLNTGYSVGDTKEELLSIFDSYGSEQFVEDYLLKVRNCKKIWDEKYKEYFNQVLIHDYITRIQQLCSKNHSY